MSVAAEILHTAEDLERLCAQGHRYELIEGELREMSPVGGGQGAGTINLSSEATVFIRKQRLGLCFGAETGFWVRSNPDTVLAPDWAFIRRERVPDPIPRSWVSVIPDLVLETRSPNDSRREIREKIDLWLGAGVRVVWDLDPVRRTLSIHRPGASVTLGAEDVLSEEGLLPGFSLRVGSIF